MSGDLLPKREKSVGLGGRIGREGIEVMNVDDSVQAVAHGIGHEKIDLRKNFRLQNKLWRRAVVMVPGNRNSNVIETLLLDVREIFGRIIYAPILARRR